jgi:hypothetical protein
MNLKEGVARFSSDRWTLKSQLHKMKRRILLRMVLPARQWYRALQAVSDLPLSPWLVTR